MFTHIDSILYPRRCEVIELTSQRFIYTIFKNGQTSLREQARRNKSRILINEQIKKCEKIEIFIREPKSRFLSGANTYINHLLRDNPNLNLDVNTIKFFIINYFCLNRHYLPQFFWLAHLSSFTNNSCVLQLQTIDNIKSATELRWDDLSKVNYITEDFAEVLLNNNSINDFLKIDEYIYQLCTTDITWEELKLQLKSEFDFIWKNNINSSLRIADVLS
jgi:hypothetical protein